MKEGRYYSFTLNVKGTEHKFDTFDELYAFFDYEVSVYDFDNVKVYVNDHYVGNSPTKIANSKLYKRWTRC